MRFDLRPAAFVLAIAVIVFGTQKCAARSHHNRQTSIANGRTTAGIVASQPIQNYQQGFQHGQNDRTNNRDGQYRQHPNCGNDGRAYELGYDQGYQNNRSSNRNNGYRDGENHDWNAEGYGTRSPGYQVGLRDGVNDGRLDRAAGLTFKYGKGHKHPGRGYVFRDVQGETECDGPVVQNWSLSVNRYSGSATPVFKSGHVWEIAEEYCCSRTT